MKTHFTVCGYWSHVLDVSKGFQFHDVSRFSESAGYVELRRNANDRGHAHGADIRVVVCGEPGKHAYARDAYARATSLYGYSPDPLTDPAFTTALIADCTTHNIASYAK